MKKIFVNLEYSEIDARGFLIDRKRKFSSFMEAIKFVRDSKNATNKAFISKPVIK